MEPVNVFDYEKLAQSRMAPPLWDYYQGGSDDEVTIRACRTAFERIKLRPRVLVDVSPDALDMRTSVLGTPISMPMLIAPMALHCMAHPEGECATAQAAGKAGTVMIASTVATRTIEEIAQAAYGPLWFQLYTYPSLKVAESLVRRWLNMHWGKSKRPLLVETPAAPESPPPQPMPAPIATGLLNRRMP